MFQLNMPESDRYVLGNAHVRSWRLGLGPGGGSGGGGACVVIVSQDNTRSTWDFWSCESIFVISPCHFFICGSFKCATQYVCTVDGGCTIFVNSQNGYFKSERRQDIKGKANVRLFHIHIHIRILFPLYHPGLVRLTFLLYICVMSFTLLSPQWVGKRLLFLDHVAKQPAILNVLKQNIFCRVQTTNFRARQTTKTLGRTNSPEILLYNGM